MMAGEEGRRGGGERKEKEKEEGGEEREGEGGIPFIMLQRTTETIAVGEY